MKNILLATTALVMSAGIASAELKFSGSARVGVKTTEAIGAKTTAKVVGAISAAAKAAAEISLRASSVANGTTTAITLSAAGATAATDIAKVKAAIALLNTAIVANQVTIDNEIAALGVASTTAVANDAADLASLTAVLNEISGSAASTTAAVASTTQSINRIRVNFDGSGETDSGLSFGASIRADNAAGGNAGTAGSQYVSGAFGTITMGDIDGVDQIFDVSGVGVAGLGFTNELTHNSTGHNASWSYSASGLTIAASTDTKIKTGDNTAYALSYAMDAGGANVKVAAGTSKSGVTTQNSYGLTVGMNGLTLKASSSTNDNGPAVAAVTETAAGSVAAGTAYVLGVAAKANPDTTQNAVSVSYAVDAVTMTAYTRDVKTSGIATATYTGFGVSYDLGGAKLVAGTVDANGTQVSDLGVSFSF